jgi:hypothetical protein
MSVSPPVDFLPGFRKTVAGACSKTNMSIHSTNPLGPCLRHHGPRDVRAWRLCWLLDAGFERPLAERLAETPTVDLHALLELVDRGCPPELAARILEPLPGQAPRT